MRSWDVQYAFDSLSETAKDLMYGRDGSDRQVPNESRQSRGRPRSAIATYHAAIAFISIPKISRSCRASAGVVLGTFPSVTHLYISCSSSRKGSSYVRRVVDSRYDPSGRVSLTTIVVGRPLMNGVSMHTFTVFVSPKTSIDASNRATRSTPDSYATAKLGYWNIALSWSVGASLVSGLDYYLQNGEPVVAQGENPMTPFGMPRISRMALKSCEPSIESVCHIISVSFVTATPSSV